MQNLFTIIVASRQTHLRRRHASWRIRRAHRGLQRDGPGGSQHCRDRDSYRRLAAGNLHCPSRQFGSEIRG